MEKVILEIHLPYSVVSQRVIVSSPRVLVGRGYHCDVILDDPYVSEEHIEITLTADGRFLVADKGSVNGVFAGVQRIGDTPVMIDSGREIKIGRTRIGLFAPRHAIQPTRSHDGFSSFLRLIDQRLVGMALSLVAAVAVACLFSLVHTNDPDYWKTDAYGIGAGFFLLIWVVWSAIHLSLVVASKKALPWPRVISYVSVVMLGLAAFWILVMPYINFYLLSDAQIMLATGFLLFVFLMISDYGLRVVCELPVKLPRLVLYSALAALLLSAASIDLEYYGNPMFPKMVITADLPLADVQPLHAFIEESLVLTVK